MPLHSIPRGLRRLFYCALTSLPLLVGSTYAYADDNDDDAADEDEADDEDTTTTITVDGGYEDTDSSAVTIYQNDLQPYGSWVVDGRYGSVWVPSSTVVGADFAPYQSSGHWELTADDEWLWVSDYSWGYIPFHYGRWVWIDGTGWAWIPGRAYAPAWVVWRIGEAGFIGWAPMPPAYYWSSGVYYSCSPPPAAYVFVETTYIYDVHVSTHVIRERADVERAANGTRQYAPANPHYGPSSPSPQAAKLPAPSQRGSADPKAVAFAHKPGFNSTKVEPVKVAPHPKKSKASRPTASPSAPKSPETTTKSGSTTTSKSTSTPKTSTSKTTTSKTTTSKTTTTTKTSKPAPTTNTTPKVVTPRTESKPKVVSTPKTTTTTTSKPANTTPKPVVVSKPSTPTTTSKPTVTTTPTVRRSTSAPVHHGRRH